jgi:DNA repair protein RecN (Recombination protein N)
VQKRYNTYTVLKKLRIKNFAIIDDLELNPSAGLNVFTGETGAGKSIIIEALSFVLGSRASTDFIKEGRNKLEVETIFTGNPLPAHIKTKHSVNSPALTLKRQLDTKGRNKSFINNTAVSVSVLSEIGDHLVDFHGQYEHQTLLKPQVHLQLLDKFANLETEVKKTAELFNKRQSVLKRLEEVKLSKEQKDRLLDLYKFQLDEIKNAQIKPNEDLQLEENLPKLKNAHKLLSLCTDAYDALYSREGSAVENISKGLKAAEELAVIDPSQEELCRNINQSLTAIEQAAVEISNYKDSIDISSQQLDTLISRQDKLASLKKKYGPELSNVLSYQTELETKISDLECSDQTEGKLQKEAQELTAELKKVCTALHEKRTQAGKKLASLLVKEIKPLGFADIKFSVCVEMDEENITSAGADTVEFLFSPNPGESLKPLKNIASGGEISRVMLGLKNVLSPENIISVFDEIDAGIGGVTGRLIGEKLKKISKNGQMFVITHLAQIAGFADTHYSVTKLTSKTATAVKTTELAKEQRVHELSRMLGGHKESKTGLQHARELLQQTKC